MISERFRGLCAGWWVSRALLVQHPAWRTSCIEFKLRNSHGLHTMLSSARVYVYVFNIVLIGGDWNMAFYFPFHIWDNPNPINELIFFRWVGQPPTSCIIELEDGKIYRKPLYLMVKTMVSCRFSLKPIHWLYVKMSLCHLSCDGSVRFAPRGSSGWTRAMGLFAKLQSQGGEGANPGRSP